jgi:hypothetical protein
MEHQLYDDEDIDWTTIFEYLEISTFEKLKCFLSEVFENLQNKNDYTIFFSLIDYITLLVENGEDINTINLKHEGNETFLSYFFYSFFDYGIELYNCKVYNLAVSTNHLEMVYFYLYK